MPVVKFTSALKRFFPDLSETHSDQESLLGMLVHLDEQHPGLTAYILDDQHKLRAHVNVFIDGTINHRRDLNRSIKDCKEIYIMQALSGG